MTDADTLPAPPAGGWNTKLTSLMVCEIDEIKRRAAVESLEEFELYRLLPLVAIAHARRDDPERYVWDHARLFCMDDLREADGDPGPRPKSSTSPRRKRSGSPASGG